MVSFVSHNDIFYVHRHSPLTHLYKSGEQRIRHRIAELQEYRRMGIISLKDASDYERDKVQRVIYYFMHKFRIKFSLKITLKANGAGALSSHSRLSGRGVYLLIFLELCL